MTPAEAKQTVLTMNEPKQKEKQNNNFLLLLTRNNKQ